MLLLYYLEVGTVLVGLRTEGMADEFLDLPPPEYARGCK